MINSCIRHPNPNGGPLDVESEVIIARSGLVEVPVSVVGVNIPNNQFGAANADIGVESDGDPFGCSFTTPNIDALQGCPNAIPLGPGDIIPPNAVVVIFLTGTTVTADAQIFDFSNICRQGTPVYILQNGCERTSGALANSSNGDDPFRSVSFNTNACLTSFTYNTTEITPDPGTYFDISTTTVGNLNCAFPVLPEICQPVDITFSICATGPTVSPAFDLTELEQQYPDSIQTVTFYETRDNAAIEANQITTYGGPTDQPDTLYARLTFEDFCINIGQVIINFRPPAITAIPPSGPLSGCDPNFIGIGEFDLTQVSAEVGGGEPVTYYEDAALTLLIDSPENYLAAVDPATPTVVYAVAGLGDCRSAAVEVELALENGPFISPVIDTADCAATADGSIDLMPSGNGPFSFDWPGADLDGQESPTGLLPGDYPVTITDAAGCIRSYDLVVPTRDNTPDFTCSLRSTPTTADSEDGEITVTVMGGTPPFRLNLFDGVTTSTFDVNGSSLILTQLGVGSYSIELVDENGCTTEPCEIDVPEIPPLDLECIMLNNTNGSSIDGSYRFRMNGGTPPYIIEVRGDNGYRDDRTLPSEGSFRLTNLQVGNYTSTVRADDGSIRTCDFTIEQVACPMEVDVRFFTNDCADANTTFVSILISGNLAGAVTTRWSLADGTPLPQFDDENDAPLTAGDYQVSVQDQSSCAPVVETFNISPIPPVTFVTDPPMMAEVSPCLSDGVIRVSPTGGGRGPYTIQLYDNATDLVIAQIDRVNTGEIVVFDQLPGGGGEVNYYVNVIDREGCASPGNIDISLVAGNPPTLLANEVVQPSCEAPNSASIALAPSGGVEPYTFEWLEYPGRTEGVVFDPVASQEDLSPGIYAVRFTDSQGCSEVFQTTLVDDRPTLVCGTTTDAPPSSTGSLSIGVSGAAPPYSFFYLGPDDSGNTADLTEGTNEISGIPPGTYEGLLSDANGCLSASCTFTIGSLGCSLAVTGTATDGNCNNSAAIRLSLENAAEPVTYTWDNGLPPNPEVFPVATGTYTVTVEDANACSVTESFTVNYADDGPVLNATPFIPPFCSSDSVKISLALTGQPPITVSYQVTGDDGTVGPQVDQVITDTLFLGGDDLIGSSGNLRLLTVGDSRCLRQLDLDLPYVRGGGQDTVFRTGIFCSGEPIVIGGQEFTTDNPSDTFLVASVGAGCDTIYAVDLEILSPGFSTEMLSFTRCAGDSVVFGGRTFNEDEPSGLAVLSGMAANGCDSLIPVVVNFINSGEVRLIGDRSICAGETTELRFGYDGQDAASVTLRGDDGTTLEVNGVRNNTTLEVSPVQTTTYSIVAASGGNDCPVPFRETSTVTVGSVAIDISEVTDPDNPCTDTLSRLRVDATGGTEPYEYLWSNGQTTEEISDLPAGTYSVMVSDANDCSTEAGLDVVSGTTLEFAVSAEGPTCPGDGGRVTIATIGGGQEPYLVRLNEDAFIPLENIGSLNPEPGAYRIEVQDATGCSRQDTFTVPPLPDTEAMLPELIDLRLGDSILLDPMITFPVDSISWTPTTAVSSPQSPVTMVSPEQTTVYTLTVVSRGGCEARYSVEVRVDRRLPVFAPTAFSPNGDEVNDTYLLNFGPQVREVTGFQIYDRWGALVHDDPTNGWDGTFNGGEAAVGVYVFTAILQLVDGTERAVAGEFLLLR